MLRDCRAYWQFPRPGGWHDQDDLEMVLMAMAGKAEQVFVKQATASKWTPDEGEFAAWVEVD